MPKTRQQKVNELDTLVTHLGTMKSVVFAGYEGLKVNEATALRRQLRAAGVVFKAIKKTLLARALAKAGLPAVALPHGSGGIALAFGVQDEVLPAKMLDAFRKDHAAVVLQGGIVQGQVYSAVQMQALAKLPSRQELLASILGALTRPIAGLCAVVSGPARGCAQVLRARSEKAAS